MAEMRICVIHLNQIGDLVFSLPLLKALRDRYPDAEIHSVMKPYLKDLLAGSPLVNETIARQGGVRETLRLARTLRRNRYDLLISLARSEEAFILTSLSRAGTKAGF
ncbi:MAG TPA: glycosyltransferase family 9 protein, partial [Deltaproteobacteria bacterium]|nr:glycosyltransferase family 9 protein [Deltaproteobacteria bacterium]